MIVPRRSSECMPLGLSKLKTSSMVEEKKDVEPLDDKMMKIPPVKILPTTLRNLIVDNNARRTMEKETELPMSYQPKIVDVICGNRGNKESNRHPGNARHRVLIEMRLQRYSRSTRREKTDIVREIVEAVRHYGGNFIRYEEYGGWVDIGNLRAREKTGHAIRAAMHKYNIPFQGDSSSVASGGTSKSSVVASQPSSNGEVVMKGESSASPSVDKIETDDSDVVVQGKSSAYLSSFDFEPLPIESETKVFFGKRDRPEGVDFPELECLHECSAATSDSFLGYERTKRRRY